MAKTDRTAAQRLQEFPLFRDCDKSDVARLTNGSAQTSVPAGWAFIQDQTPGDACYVILSGSAEVKKGTERVATLEAGDVVGEIALVTAGLRTATVVALEPTELLRIDASSFAKLVADRPRLREALTASHRN